MKSEIKFRAKSKTKDFFYTLRKEIDGYFDKTGRGRHGNVQSVIKGLGFIVAYLAAYVSLFVFASSTWAVIGIYALIGLLSVGIGFGVVHEANHGTLFKNTKLNRIFSYSLNLMGLVCSNWKVQHNLIHHSYTNIHGFDEDIKNTGVIQLAPFGKKSFLHRFQAFYSIFLYCISNLWWVLFKDFMQYKRYTEKGKYQAMKMKPGMVLGEIILTKVIYFTYILVLPILLGGFSVGLIVGGFILMHVISSLITTLVFQLAHVVEDTAYNEVHDGNTIEDSWAAMQVQSSANFKVKFPPLDWFMSGMNYQIEHHLFPRISYVHYKAISKIVAKTAREFDLPYNQYPSMGSAIASHFRQMHVNGIG